MALTIKVYSDYVCPFCKALHHAYEEAKITAAPTFVIGDTAVKWLLNKEQFLEVIDVELAKRQRLESWTEGLSCRADGCS